MKNQFIKERSYLILSVCCILFAACSTLPDDMAEESIITTDIILHSNISKDEFDNMYNKVDSLVSLEIATKAVGEDSVITEKNAKEVFTPFMVEGERLRNEILADMKINPNSYTQNEIDSLMSFTDYQLAVLGFAV